MAFKLLVHPIRMMITGRVGYGKTTLVVNEIIKDWMSHQVDEIICICPSFPFQKTFDPIRGSIKSENVYTDVEDGLKKTLIKILKDLRDRRIEQVEDKLKRLRSKGIVREFVPRPKKRWLVIVDDVQASKGVKSTNRTSILDQLATQSRHWSVSIIGIFQQSICAPLSFRDNLNAFISFPTNSLRDFMLILREWNVNQKLSLPEMRELLQTSWNLGDFFYAFNPVRRPTRYFSGWEIELKIDI